jgi:hypothetical protein
LKKLHFLNVIVNLFYILKSEFNLDWALHKRAPGAPQRAIALNSKISTTVFA